MKRKKIDTLADKLYRMSHSKDNLNEARIAQQKLRDMGIDYRTYEPSNEYEDAESEWEAEMKRQHQDFATEYYKEFIERMERQAAAKRAMEMRMKAAFLVRYSKESDLLILLSIIKGLKIKAFRQRNKRNTDYLKRIYIEFKNENEKLIFEIYKDYWINKYLKVQAKTAIEKFINNNDFSQIPKNQLKFHFK